MKSTKKLLSKSRTYLNGDIAYYGDVTRYYTSFFLIKMVARVVKKPEGSETLFSSDSELKSAVSRIPFGQIGAKYDSVSVPANTQLAEFIMPVAFNEETDLKDSIVEMFNTTTRFGDLEFITKDNKCLNFVEAKEHMRPFRESNSQIRNSWISKAQSLKKFGASAQEILDEKISLYKGYLALCDYTLVIEFTITHIVNNPCLQSTIVNNNDYTQEQYNALAYKEGKYRKSATFKAPLITIPLQKVEQYEMLKESFNQLLKTSEHGQPFGGREFQRVITDGMIDSDGKVIDLKYYEKMDREITARENKKSRSN